MADYLTDFGVNGAGEGVNAEPRLAIKYTHDILRRAAKEQLDVFMICGTLRDNLRGTLYTQVTRHSFAQSVEEVLRAGGDVSILVWSGDPKDYEIPEFRKLAEHAKAYSGKLAIRASGTSEGSDHVTHFIVAKKRDDSRWIVRVEKPHDILTEDSVSDETFRVPAAVVFTSQTAEKYGRNLMNIFRCLFDAIPSPLARDEDGCLVEGAIG